MRDLRGAPPQQRPSADAALLDEPTSEVPVVTPSTRPEAPTDQGSDSTADAPAEDAPAVGDPAASDPDDDAEAGPVSAVSRTLGAGLDLESEPTTAITPPAADAAAPDPVSPGATDRVVPEGTDRDGRGAAPPGPADWPPAPAGDAAVPPGTAEVASGGSAGLDLDTADTPDAAPDPGPETDVEGDGPDAGPAADAAAGTAPDRPSAGPAAEGSTPHPTAYESGSVPDASAPIETRTTTETETAVQTRSDHAAEAAEPAAPTPTATPPVVSSFDSPVDPAATADRAGSAGSAAAGSEAGPGSGGAAAGQTEAPRIALWPDEAADRLRAQWRDLQVQFIDDPAAAVAGAKELVTDAVQELATTLLEAQEALDPFQREGAAAADTEAMRMAMRRYREFLDRVLAL